MKCYLTARTVLGLTLCLTVITAHAVGVPLDLMAGWFGDGHTALAGLGTIPFMIGDTGEIKKLLEDQGKAWEEFKSANDRRLEALEKKGYAPAELSETVTKLNGELDRIAAELKKEQENADRLEKLLNRPGGTKSDLSPEEIEHKTAFTEFFRKGRTAADLQDLERKALRTNSDVDGGYLVTRELDSALDRVAETVGGLALLATTRNVGSKTYGKRVKTSGLAGRWVDEQEAGGETTNPKYSLIEIPVHKIEVEPWISNDMLEDADYDVEMDVTDEAGIAFAETENAAFISGNGIKKPRGILSYTIVANASYEWGKIGYIASGASGAFAASNPGDKLIDLQHALRQQYRQGAAWLMGDATLAKVRQIKDGSGNFYLWNPDPGGGFGGRILGSPVQVDDNMPAMAADSYSIAYGNFRRGYTITRRRGTILIRDNITTKGTTKFNMTRRIGGGITHFEAVKVMKFAAS